MYKTNDSDNRQVQADKLSNPGVIWFLRVRGHTDLSTGRWGSLTETRPGQLVGKPNWEAHQELLPLFHFLYLYRLEREGCTNVQACAHTCTNTQALVMQWNQEFSSTVQDLKGKSQETQHFCHLWVKQLISWQIDFLCCNLPLLVYEGSLASTWPTWLCIIPPWELPAPPPSPQGQPSSENTAPRSHNKGTAASLHVCCPQDCGRTGRSQLHCHFPHQSLTLLKFSGMTFHSRKTHTPVMWRKGEKKKKRVGEKCGRKSSHFQTFCPKSWMWFPIDS